MKMRKKLLSSSTASLAALVAGTFTLGACSSDPASPGDDGGGPGVDAGPIGPTLSTDWTMLGYDTTSNYWNKAETKLTRENAPNLEKAWEFDAGGPVTGTPLIVGNRVFIMSAGDLTNPEIPGIYALDAKTGKEIWSTTTTVGSSTLAYDDGVLYVNEFAGNIKAISAEDGTEIWKYDPDEHPNMLGYSSPILTEDYVLVGGSGAEELVIASGSASFRGFVVAVNKKDGTLAWKKYTVEPPASGATLWSSVSVDLEAGLVVAGTGNNYTDVLTDTSDAFLGIDLKDGSGDFKYKTQVLEGDLWTQRIPGGGPDYDFGANPTLVDVDGKKLAIAGAKSGTVHVIDRITGEKLPNGERNLGPGSASRGGVFINGAYDGKSFLVACNGATSDAPNGEATTDGPSVLFALDPVTLDIRWERQLGGVVYGPITVANGVGFVSNGKKLQAFNTETGDKLFEFDTKLTIASGAAISNGLVVFGAGMPWFGTTNGTMVYAFKVPE